MKRKLFLLNLFIYSVLLLTALFFLPVQTSFAQISIDSLNISDAVTADLAIKGYLDNISVAYNDGSQTNKIDINGTRHWLPASTVKLFAAMYAFKQIQNNQLHTWDLITADAKNVVPNEFVSDELPTIQQGDQISIERLIKQMITQSDNTAFNMLLDTLDRQKITQYIHDLGLIHSAVGSKLNLDTSQEQYEYDVPGYGINTTTADDYTKAFVLIKNNKLAGAKNLFEILKQQKIRYMIPLLLPKDVTVANKHGDLDPLFHDGGIVISPDKKVSFAVSIFSNLGDPNIVAHLAELIYTKNSDLVGQTSEKPVTPEKNPSIDPLVAQRTSQKENVLGANTFPIQTQPITAADLGITANDLSLGVSTKSLPSVLIPADSPFHFLVPTWQFVKRSVALTPEAKTQSQLADLNLQLAEAKDQKDKGNTKLANQILQNTQNQLVMLAHSKSVQENPLSQNIIQSTSETRFSILGDELKKAKKSERIELIKEIASQAKSTLQDVQPFIPSATNAINPSQKPLIGEVISVTSNTATVKTPGGQELTVPIDNPTTKIKSKVDTIPAPIVSQSVESQPITPVTTPMPVPSVAPILVGTTVAMVGSSDGKVFTPSFILTNVSRQLVAPQPVQVVKVNTKNNTMVVSDNGVPVQVNITNQTIIKGNDTSVALKAIKPGDIIVVHGEPLVSPVPSTQQNTITTPTILAPTSTNQGPSIHINNNSQTSPNGIIVTPVVTPTSANSIIKVAPAVISSTQEKTYTISVSPAKASTNLNTKIPINSGPNGNNPQQKNSQNNNGSTKPVINVPYNNTIRSTQTNTTTIQQNSIQTKPQTQPQVIRSTSIQYIEKAQDVKNNPQQQQPSSSVNNTPHQTQQTQTKPPTNNSSSQSQQKPASNNSQPQQQSQPNTLPQQSNTTQKDNKQNTKK